MKQSQDPQTDVRTVINVKMPSIARIVFGSIFLGLLRCKCSFVFSFLSSLFNEASACKAVLFEKIYLATSLVGLLVHQNLFRSLA
jgi:hypothetical protein